MLRVGRALFQAAQEGPRVSLGTLKPLLFLCRLL